MQSLQRRELFETIIGKFVRPKNEERIVVRPPYFQDTNEFSQCHLCAHQKCIPACPEDILSFDETFGVVIDFGHGGCTFCDECAKVCDRSVLQVEFKKTKLAQRVSINMIGCIAWAGIICSSCKDACYDNGLDFLGMLRPSINTNCTNCGACISRCPTDAISIKERL